MSITTIADVAFGAGALLLIVSMVSFLVFVFRSDRDYTLSYLIRTRPRWRVLAACFVLGFILAAIGQILQGTEAYQRQLKPPSPLEEEIGHYFGLVLAYGLCLIAVLGGLVGVYFSVSSLLVSAIRSAAQRTWLDQRLMVLAAGLLMTLLVGGLSSLMAVGGGYLLMTGRVGTLLLDASDAEAGPAEDYLRMVTAGTPLLDAPSLQARQLAQVREGESVMLLFNVWRGASPVNGYLPCVINSGPERLRKGWIPASHLRPVPEQERTGFFKAFLGGILSRRALAEMALDALLSAVICLILLVLLGAFVEHYAALAISGAAVAALVAKYSIWGVGAVLPPLVMLEAAVMVGVDALVTAVVDRLGLPRLLRR